MASGMAMGRWSRAPLRACAAAAVLTVAAGLAAPRPAQAQFFWEQPRFSSDDAARIAIQHGFRVLARPIRNNDVYVTQVVDRRGARAQLIIAADSGRILQRFYVEADRMERADRDPTILPGPIPPGRVPMRERRPDGGFFARLFGDDTPDAGDAAEPSRRSYGDRPLFNGPDQPVRAPRARRQPRVVESAPETIHQEPVESAPLAPPPSLPRTAAPPRTAPVRTPAEASLPAAGAPATPPAAIDRSGRAISSNPLAIPGSREQDEKAAQATHGPARAAAPAPVKPPDTPKAPVAVAPLE